MEGIESFSDVVEYCVENILLNDKDAGFKSIFNSVACAWLKGHCLNQFIRLDTDEIYEDSELEKIIVPLDTEENIRPIFEKILGYFNLPEEELTADIRSTILNVFIYNEILQIVLDNKNFNVVEYEATSMEDAENRLEYFKEDTKNSSDNNKIMIILDDCYIRNIVRIADIEKLKFGN